MIGYLLHRLLHHCRTLRSRARYRSACKRYEVKVPLTDPHQRLLIDLRAIDLLRRTRKGAPWQTSELYPSGAAADHKLLYLLVRSLETFDFDRVVECGGGQTTRILADYSRSKPTAIWTFEHDAGWSRLLEELPRSEGHRLVHAPLRPMRVPPVGEVPWYDLDLGPTEEEKIGLLVVDGPIGQARWARCGVVPWFGKRRAEDWLVIWDDLERPGDIESFGLLLDGLRRDGVTFDYRVVTGVKNVGIVATPSYRDALYFL